MYVPAFAIASGEMIASDIHGQVLYLAIPLLLL
jgi:hypothetical protein